MKRGMVIFFVLIGWCGAGANPTRVIAPGSGIRQLISVRSTDGVSTAAQRWLFEKAKWRKVGAEFPVVVGRSGTTPASKKFEGDGKTPEGLYPLSKLFTRGKTEGYNLETIKIVREDKWIDDPEHADYNRWVRGPTTAKSYENLYLSTPVYNRILVIDYNMNPTVRGKGSAIFFHIWSGPKQGTLGCVATDRKTLESVLKWLDQNLKPAIFIGNL